jgi:hypothetical protein
MQTFWDLLVVSPVSWKYSIGLDSPNSMSLVTPLISFFFWFRNGFFPLYFLTSPITFFSQLYSNRKFHIFCRSSQVLLLVERSIRRGRASPPHLSAHSSRFEIKMAFPWNDDSYVLRLAPFLIIHVSTCIASKFEDEAVLVCLSA